MSPALKPTSAHPQLLTALITLIAVAFNDGQVGMIQQPIASRREHCSRSATLTMLFSETG
jgi:hypothetical protein